MLLHTQDFLRIETMLLHFPAMELSRLGGGGANGGGSSASSSDGVGDNICQDLMLEFSQQVRESDLLSQCSFSFVA